MSIISATVTNATTSPPQAVEDRAKRQRHEDQAAAAQHDIAVKLVEEAASNAMTEESTTRCVEEPWSVPTPPPIATSKFLVTPFIT